MLGKRGQDHALREIEVVDVLGALGGRVGLAGYAAWANVGYSDPDRVRSALRGSDDWRRVAGFQSSLVAGEFYRGRACVARPPLTVYAGGHALIAADVWDFGVHRHVHLVAVEGAQQSVGAGWDRVATLFSQYEDRAGWSRGTSSIRLRVPIGRACVRMSEFCVFGVLCIACSSPLPVPVAFAWDRRRGWRCFPDRSAATRFSMCVTCRTYAAGQPATLTCAATSRRERTWSLVWMCDACVSTVRGESWSCPAISGFDKAWDAISATRIHVPASRPWGPGSPLSWRAGQRRPTRCSAGGLQLIQEARRLTWRRRGRRRGGPFAGSW